MEIFINTTYSKIDIFVVDNKALYQKLSNNNHTVVLYQVLEEMFLKENKTFKDISKVYVVNGPGSYTGTRVGVILAKVIAKELNINIVPINLLQIMYLTNKKKSCSDARGNKYFCYDGKKFYIQSIEETLNEGYKIENEIVYEEVVKYLGKFRNIPVNEVEVEYLKEAI